MSYHKVYRVTLIDHNKDERQFLQSGLNGNDAFDKLCRKLDRSLPLGGQPIESCKVQSVAREC